MSAGSGVVGVVVTDETRYLSLATTLLQRMRRAWPEGGVWEAADIQWWSRERRPTDEAGQLFWMDGQGTPVAACIRTQFGRTAQHDVLILPQDPGLHREVWRTAIASAAAGAAGADACFVVRLDDAAGRAELADAGYVLRDAAAVVSCWLDAASRPPIPPLPAGYRLLSRADEPDRPYPLIARNGAAVEQRLHACSLYRPELDLMVEAPDGQAAAYGLFWADHVTGVGLVEPIRTEDAHQGRGIASHLVSSGLALLAEAACRRLKVASDRDLYRRAGFRPLATATAAEYARPGG